jgi:uncharacterized protein YqhQ
MSDTSAPARPYIGGQAVIEGVMMRAPTGVAVAVRRPDGSLAVRQEPLPARLTASFWKLPLLRGIGTLFESFSLGYSALQWSAEQQDPSLAQSVVGSTQALLLAPVVAFAATEERASNEESEPAPVAAPPAAKASGGTNWAMVISVVFAIAIFKALPQVLAALASWGTGWDLELGDWRFHALTGGFKLLVVLGYMVAIGSVPEIRRVFQYHGAEHKTIFAYEAERALNVANVRAQPRLHPRCGTTFLLVVVVVSVVVGSIVTPLLLPHAAGFFGQLQILVLTVAMLPAVAAISYELQRLSARYCTTGPLRALLVPGFLLQKITTREPDDTQLEVAIASLQTLPFEPTSKPV